jgi:hypothetical protein
VEWVPTKTFRKYIRQIEALIVLDNMAIDFKDHPDIVWRFDEDPGDQEDENDGDREIIVFNVVGDAEVPAYKTDIYLKEQGRIKRLAILDKLF